MSEVQLLEHTTTNTTAAPPPSRRSFINWFLGTTVGALFVSMLYPILRFVSPPRIPEAATNQVEGIAVPVETVAPS